MDIVIPWRDGCPHRQRALTWVTNRYRQLGHNVVLGECPDGPWVKALAVQDGLRRTDGGIIVIADADVWCDGLHDSIDAVADGAWWSIPHHTVHRLTEDATAQFMADGKPTDTIERPYKGRAGGGIAVIRRAVWEQTPMDPRFAGWGGEDDAWNLAVCSVFDKPARFDADLWHLWHPPQSRMTRGKGTEANWALQQRYLIARRSPDAMEQLITEARELLEVA